MPWRSRCCGFLGNEIEALVFAVAVLPGAGRGHRADHPAPARPVFLLADTGVFADRLRDRLQMDRPHRRRERPAGRAAPAAARPIGSSTSSPSSPSCVGMAAAVAHRARAVRPRAAGAARQRTARAKPRLRHVPHQIQGVRHHGRRGRLRRRAARLHAARRLRRQPELAARRRRAADDRAGRRAPFPRPALGRHRLHPVAGPALRHHRKLVADVRADRDAVRAGLARGHAGPGVPPDRPQRLDADAARHPAAAGAYRAVPTAPARNSIPTSRS